MTFANTFANGLLFANKYLVRVRVRARGPGGVRVRVRVRARGPGGVRVRVRVRVRPIFSFAFFLSFHRIYKVSSQDRASLYYKLLQHVN